MCVCVCVCVLSSGFASVMEVSFGSMYVTLVDMHVVFILCHTVVCPVSMKSSNIHTYTHRERTSEGSSATTKPSGCY